MYKAWMFKQKSFRLQNPDDGNGNQNGGGGGDEAAAKAAADKAAAEAAAAAASGDPKAAELKALADEKADLLKEVMAKKEKIRSLESDATDLKAKLAQFEGIDPVKVKALLAEQAENERKQLEAKGDFEALKKQMVEAHEKDKKVLNDRLSEQEKTVGSLQAQIAELTVGNAFGASSYLKEELVLTTTKARVIYGTHFEYKDGKVVAYDKPAGEAGRAMLVDGKGDPLAFDAALEKIVEADPDKDTVKKAKSKQGSGSKTDSTGKTPAATGPALTGREKIAAGLAKKKQ